jgi:hypothetical protein
MNWKEPCFQIFARWWHMADARPTTPFIEMFGSRMGPTRHGGISTGTFFSTTPASHRPCSSWDREGKPLRVITADQENRLS